MAPSKPPDLDRDHQPFAPEEIAALRELLPYAETIREGAISRDRWRWLRSLSGSTITWAGIGLAFLASLKDEIVDGFRATFGGGP